MKFETFTGRDGKTFDVQMPTPVFNPTREMLLSDAEREHCVLTLHQAFRDGRLTVEEFDWRTERAYAARYGSELAHLTQDIPQALPVPQKPAYKPLPVSSRVAQVAVRLSRFFFVGVCALAAVWMSWIMFIVASIVALIVFVLCPSLTYL